MKAQMTKMTKEYISMYSSYTLYHLLHTNRIEPNQSTALRTIEELVRQMFVHEMDKTGKEYTQSAYRTTVRMARDEFNQLQSMRRTQRLINDAARFAESEFPHWL